MTPLALTVGQVHMLNICRDVRIQADAAQRMHGWAPDVRGILITCQPDPTSQHSASTPLRSHGQDCPFTPTCSDSVAISLQLLQERPLTGSSSIGLHRPLTDSSERTSARLSLAKQGNSAQPRGAPKQLAGRRHD